MKKILRLFIFGAISTFFIFSNSFAVCPDNPSDCYSGTTTKTVVDCTYAAVNAAVQAASRGDVITVPACSETIWPSTLTLTKSITLKGAGKDSTNIAAGPGIGANGLIFYVPLDAYSENGYTFRVTGFTLNTNGIETDAIHIRNASTNYVQVRIDNNKFLDNSITSTYRMVRNEGTIKGVIDSNIFNTSHKKIIDSYGLNTARDWSELEFSFGSANNIYIEDNNITILNTPHSVGQGGRHVIRYNTYTYNGTSTLSPWMDAHGNQNASICNSWATRGVEWYGNVITSTYNKEIVGLSQRGGQALGFYNKVITTAGGNNFWVWEEYADSACSSVYTQSINNSYYWANFINSRAPIYQIPMDYLNRDASLRNSPLKIVPNSSHWTQVGSFTGVLGIGCGIYTKKPSTCSTGVVFWETYQSCTDPTGMIGANPSTPIAGMLWKCTAPNTWTQFYAPYTYPHPLRADSGSTTSTSGTSSTPSTSGTTSTSTTTDSGSTTSTSSGTSSTSSGTTTSTSSGTGSTTSTATSTTAKPTSKSKRRW